MEGVGKRQKKKQSTQGRVTEKKFCEREEEGNPAEGICM